MIGSRRDRRGEFRIKAVLDHGVDLDLAKAAGVRNRGAAHAGEDDGSHDVGMAEAAGDRTDPSGAGTENLSRNAAGVHQFGRQDEEGDRKQRIAAGVTDHAVENGRDGEVSGHQHGKDGGNGQGEGDGHAQYHQQQKAADQHKNISCKAHTSMPSSPLNAFGASSGLRFRIRSIRCTTENAQPIGKLR